ncbi:unnamed protein product [Lupinus luteus]|uniref:X8 domain-containing protein n=1 Tax=Lupinus luteus TaxID=3873 RepID=A0AAV1XTM7_LUPLU
MAAPNLSYFLLLTIVAGIIVGSNNMKKVDAATKTWCIANLFIPLNVLKPQLEYACRNGADCAPITPGGSCFLPNSTLNHASYAFNSFYKRKGSCDFARLSLLSVTDPSMSLLLFYE